MNVCYLPRLGGVLYWGFLVIVDISGWIFHFSFCVVIPEFCYSLFTFYLPVFYLLDAAYVFKQQS